MTIDEGTDLSELPHWEDEAEIWETVHLGDLTLPGIATVSIDRGKKVDVKDAKGKQKAKVTVQGYQPARVEITLRLLDRRDLASLARILPQLEPVPDKTKATEADCFDIAHPVAALRGLRSILIEKLKGPALDSDGIMSLSITAIEFDPPKKTPTGVGSGKPGSVSWNGVANGGYQYVGSFVTDYGALQPQSLICKLVAGTPENGTWEIKPGTANWAITSPFKGKFVGHDIPLQRKLDEEELARLSQPDATKTPDKSKGSDLKSLETPEATGPAAPAVPDPADEDPWASP